MTEELARSVYLRCTRGDCNAWLGMFGLPSRCTPKLAAAAPSHGWVRQADGSWVCDEHGEQAGE